MHHAMTSADRAQQNRAISADGLFHDVEKGNGPKAPDAGRELTASQHDALIVVFEGKGLKQVKQRGPRLSGNRAVIPGFRTVVRTGEIRMTHKKAIVSRQIRMRHFLEYI